MDPRPPDSFGFGIREFTSFSTREIIHNHKIKNKVNVKYQSKWKSWELLIVANVLRIFGTTHVDLIHRLNANNNHKDPKIEGVHSDLFYSISHRSIVMNYVAMQIDRLCSGSQKFLFLSRYDLILTYISLNNVIELGKKKGRQFQTFDGSLSADEKKYFFNNVGPKIMTMLNRSIVDNMFWVVMSDEE